MKQDKIALKGSFMGLALPMLMMGSMSAFADVRHNVAEFVNDNKEVRITVCDTRMVDDASVSYRYSNTTNNLPPNSRAAEMDIPGKGKLMCARRTFAQTSIPTDRDLIVSFQDRSRNPAVQVDIRVDLSSVSGKAPAPAPAAAAPQESPPARTVAPQRPATQAPSAGPTTTVTPSQQRATGPTDNRRSFDRQMLADSARTAGTRYAQVIMDTIGQAEMIRRNFFMGLAQQRDRYTAPIGQQGLARFLEEVDRSPAFLQGQRGIGMDRVRQAQQAGRQAGAREAAELANRWVNEDMPRAVENARAQHSTRLEPANRDVAGAANSYRGANLDMRNQQVASIEQRYQSEQRQLVDWARNRMRVRRDIRYPNDFADRFLDFSGLLNMQLSDAGVNAMPNADLMGARAFDLWNRDIFASDDPQDRAIATNYEVATDNNRTLNAADNEQLFRDAFIAAYEAKMRAEWKRTVEALDPEATNYGANLYTRLIDSLAKERGEQSQIQTEFSNASRVEYGSVLGTAYIQAFNQVAQSRANHAVINVGQFQIVGDAGVDPGNVSLGDTFSVRVLDAKNDGFASGQVVIQVEGNAFTVASNARFEMQGLQVIRPNEPVSLQSVILVTNLNSALSRGKFPAVLPLTVKVGDRQATLNLEIKFEGLVRRLAQTTENGNSVRDRSAQTLLEIITKALTAEWDATASNSGNGYEDNKGKLLIEKLADVALTLSPQEHERLRSFSDAFLKTINEGSSSSGWLSWHSDDIASARAILRRANLL